ncbi:hypothetical protein ACFXAZ_29215 [Streptomyces sp. NPDC059477]|uniref:hypothetical protein n=1 Tax=Streptomyces sp. NPDC059477 TaxID=3346847 RepID=UPI00368EDCA6
MAPVQLLVRRVVAGPHPRDQLTVGGRHLPGRRQHPAGPPRPLRRHAPLAVLPGEIALARPSALRRYGTAAARLTAPSQKRPCAGCTERRATPITDPVTTLRRNLGPIRTPDGPTARTARPRKPPPVLDRLPALLGNPPAALDGLPTLRRKPHYAFGSTPTGRPRVRRAAPAAPLAPVGPAEPPGPTPLAGNLRSRLASGARVAVTE